MASLLLKQFTRLTLASGFSKKPALTVPSLLADTKRYLITQNEKQWIKENSILLKEKAKNEKGPELKIDLNQPQLYFEKSEELKTADETVKKLLSLKYAAKDDIKRYVEDVVRKEYRRNLIDDNSLEIQIVNHTLNIRRMCKNLEDYRGKNKTVEFYMYRQIHRRDRLLLSLFHSDNKRYEWLLQQLNMTDYKLKEGYEYKRQTRYEKFTSDVLELNRERRRNKLEEVKATFDKQKPVFYKERNACLERIKQELAEMGFTDLKFPRFGNKI